MIVYKKKEDVPGHLKTKGELFDMKLLPAPFPAAQLAAGKQFFYLFDARAASPRKKSGPRALEATPENLAKAVYTINRHAKTSPNSRPLYDLKRKAIEKLIAEGKAEKIAVHRSPNPFKKQQSLDVLVKVGEYAFHIPYSPKDAHLLGRLEASDASARNPKASMPFHQARELLERYVSAKPGRS